MVLQHLFEKIAFRDFSREKEFSSFLKQNHTVQVKTIKLEEDSLWTGKVFRFCEDRKSICKLEAHQTDTTSVQRYFAGLLVPDLCI